MPKPGSSVSQTTTSLLVGSKPSTTDLESFCLMKWRSPGKREVSRKERNDACRIVHQMSHAPQLTPHQRDNEPECAKSKVIEQAPVRLLISGFRVRAPERPPRIQGLRRRMLPAQPLGRL